MSVSGTVSCIFYICDSRKADVPVADQNTAKLKALCRVIACCIAKLMAVQGTVDEVIGSIEFTHGACLQEGMSLIRTSRCFFLTGNSNVFRSHFYSKHICRVQLEAHCTVLSRLGSIKQKGISLKGKACIKIQLSIIIHKNARVKLQRLLFLSNRSAVCIFYITIEFIFACRLVTDSHRDHLGAAHEIIKIESSVRSLDHIRCCQTICKTDLRCCRILLSFENNTLITPVAQIVYRR